MAIEALGCDLAPSSMLAQAQTVWPAAVGAQIAAHCEPAFERAGTLTVICDSSVWAAELEMRSGDLLAALNEALKPRCAVARLRFQTR